MNLNPQRQQIQHCLNSMKSFSSSYNQGYEFKIKLTNDPDFDQGNNEALHKSNPIRFEI